MKNFDEETAWQEYDKLFVTCPFCKTVIEITNNDLESCPKCKCEVSQPSYCGFCESPWTFRRSTRGK